jgi:D-lactate dehydrogenase (cytochrome)
MLGFPSFIRDRSVVEGYLRDASNTLGQADAVVRPRNTDEVAAVLEWCQREGMPVNVSAQRTATTGAAVPDGGLVLSTEALLGGSLENGYGAGEILGQVQARLEAEGRLFPPDPTSRNECSLGGAIACNASGARSFRYGAMRSWVDWVEVVLADGRICLADRDTPLPEGWPRLHWLEPEVKSAAGYFPAGNLLDVLIGSEGTLGIVTRVGLRTSSLPVGVLAFWAFFEDLDSTLAFVALAREHAVRARSRPEAPGELQPRALEYFDGAAIGMVRARVGGIPETARHGLMVEVEHEGEPPLEPWFALLEETGALIDATIVAEDERGRARFHAARHAVPAGINERLVRSGQPKVGTDFSVPDINLRQMMLAYAEVRIPNICFGHIGDNHLHLNMLPRSPDELDIARAQYKDLAHLAISLGGSVSAEHGIGKIKRGLLADMVGPSVLAGFRELKAAADPAWILGRGNLLVPPPTFVGHSV